MINEQTMQVMYESKDAEAWVTDVLWSPEGDTLAVASADGNIYLYNNDDYAIKGEFDDGSVFRLVCPIGVVLKWSLIGFFVLFSYAIQRTMRWAHHTERR